MLGGVFFFVSTTVLGLSAGDKEELDKMVQWWKCMGC